jgi:hypothetical protein
VAANDIAHPAKRLGRPERLGEAAELIKVLLERAGGSMDAAELKGKVMKETGIGNTTYKEAKKLAGAESRKATGFGADGRWVVSLKDPDPGMAAGDRRKRRER